MDPFLHIVGDLRATLDRLGLMAPRALCGADLRGGPDTPGDAPTCPTCMRKAGWTRDEN